MQTFEVDRKQIYSVFQPIYSFSNQACIGVEALVRGVYIDSQQAVPVCDCLKISNGISQTDFSRKLNETHLKNWLRRETTESWVFLNLDFNNLNSLSDLCLAEVIEELGLSGRHLVIEVVESEIIDEEIFEELISVLRNLGCLIALDDFGAGHSNIDRIWKAEPDIVKLDRQVLLEATKSLRSQSILRNLTRLIQQAGSICLLEGIETKEQALLAMDAGVDLVQGFYFARPEVDALNIEYGEKLVHEIIDFYPEYLREKNFVRNIQKKGYEALFDELHGFDSVAEIEQKMLSFSAMSFVKRIFILDAEGYQVSNEYPSGKPDESSRDVLKKSKGLCWKNRRYFIKAQQNLGDIYVSEPYRSLVDVELCLTISKVIQTTRGESFVACYDVYYHDKSISSVQISV